MAHWKDNWKILEISYFAEQENQADYTNETKDLVLDLKGELVVAREEIARMKSAGMGESVQTKQAVSQLQEALELLGYCRKV